MPSIIEVKNLRKTFNSQIAVDGISFGVKEGEIFGLLGPNGAGKSTTISILSGLLEPTDGEAVIDGKSIAKNPMGVKKILGVIPQEVALYPTLTARENLHFWGRMYDLSGSELKKRTEEVLALVGLTDRAKDRIDTYSGGMKRRINIAAGLLHRPKVLMMDEPTVGIDPQSRINILETVQNLNREGMTILYTSHYMEEVELLCDRIAIMDLGKIIAEGTEEELRQLVGNEDLIKVLVSEVTPECIDKIKTVPRVDKVTQTGEAEIHILSKEGRRALADVIKAIDKCDVKINSIEVVEPDLESVFIHLTGKSLRD
jgi:ABC-2 type transport system ATP-binding protein